MMTTWNYDRERARSGYQKMECLLGTLCRHMGEGCGPSPVPTGNCLPVMVTTAPVPPANGPHLGPWRVAVIRVEETPAGDASGSEFPCAETDRQRPIDLPEVVGNVCPALLADPPPPPSWFDELCWLRWPVFTRGEDTGTITAYGTYTKIQIFLRKGV